MRVQVVVSGRLSAHFVEAVAPRYLDVDVGDGAIRVAVTGPEDRAFASIWCEGRCAVTSITELRPVDVGADRKHETLIVTNDGQYIASRPVFVPDEQIARAMDSIHASLARIASLLRWRFRIFGSDSVFAETGCWIVLDSGERVELTRLPDVGFGDDRSVVSDDGWASVTDLLGSSVDEPLGHQLLREAWNLRIRNPRSSLIIGVAAAEVGMKVLIGDLVPAVRALVDDLPAPPLVKLMKHSLRDLPIRVDVTPDRRCPKPLLKALDAAVQARNDVAHKGAFPSVQLYETLQAIREFLYLLDLYSGQEWVVEHLSEATLNSLGLRL